MMTADKFFEREAVSAWVSRIDRIAARLERKVHIMEVCGTHTQAIAAAGLRRMLPPNVHLTSGPGCPVCVTPVDYLDHAVALAQRGDVIICTFGDLMRVPASYTTLEEQSADGGDIRIVYSPQDAVQVAREHPEKRVVLLAVGFETTLPTIAGALEHAEADNVSNFMALMGGRLIAPPLRVLAADPEVEVEAFLLPGHVSVIVGADFYAFLEDEFKVSGVIVGFTPVDILTGIAELLEQLATGTCRITNRYGRVVSAEGNRVARRLLEKYFEPCDTTWRGLGRIPASGLRFRSEFAYRDASTLEVSLPEPKEPPGCRCGDVLKGTITPPECPLFEGSCTPENPIGACMVSNEGTCAAYYRHERIHLERV